MRYKDDIEGAALSAADWLCIHCGWPVTAHPWIMSASSAGGGAASTRSLSTVSATPTNSAPIRVAHGTVCASLTSASIRRRQRHGGSDHRWWSTRVYEWSAEG